MLQKPWFKVFVWFLATFFFFLASGVVISILKPGPSETEVMQFMMGMMSAMENSIMGLAMGIEHNYALRSIIALSVTMFWPIVVMCIIAGLLIRFINRREKNV